MIRPELKNFAWDRQELVEIERADPTVRGGCDDFLLMTKNRFAQLARQYPRRFDVEAARTIPRLDQRLHTVLFFKIEVGILPGDRAGAGRRGFKDSELRWRPRDDKLMPKPVGVGQTQRVGPSPAHDPNMLPLPCRRHIA